MKTGGMISNVGRVKVVHLAIQVCVEGTAGSENICTMEVANGLKGRLED